MSKGAGMGTIALTGVGGNACLKLSKITTIPWQTIMSKNIADLTFGVKRADGYISCIWRLWVTKNGNVYLTTKSALGRVHKCSIHRSGNCRTAFRSEYAKARKNGDRVVNEWTRANTPPKGEHKGSLPLCINIPTNYLSRSSKNESLENVTWIEAAPEGSAVQFQFWITYENENTIKGLFTKTDIQSKLHLISPLLDDQSFVLTSHEVIFAQGDFSVSDHPDSIFGPLKICSVDPENTGRPIKFSGEILHAEEKRLDINEWGAYPDQPAFEVEFNHTTDLSTKRYKRKPITDALSSLTPSPTDHKFLNEFFGRNSGESNQ
jgi:hypothetical protein